MPRRRWIRRNRGSTPPLTWTNGVPPEPHSTDAQNSTRGREGPLNSMNWPPIALRLFVESQKSTPESKRTLYRVVVMKEEEAVRALWVAQTKSLPIGTGTNTH